MGSHGGIAAAMAAVGILALFFVLVGLAFYVLKSIALSTMAANRGIDKPWLAWLPIADLYITGLLVGDMDIFGYHLDNMGLWCPVIFVGGGLLSSIPHIGALFSLALLVFTIIFVYKLFTIYSPQQAVLYTVLSVLLGLYSIFLFVVRNNVVVAPIDKKLSSGPPISDI